jgi:hypothetical protein
MLRCLRIAALLVALPVTAFGQPPAMSGLVRHRTTGQPLECLHVALADSLDRTVAHTVTDSAGMFVLVAPDTGSYRVQFDVLGAEPLTGPLTRLAAGEMNEQEYPLSFDRRISGELELAWSSRGGKVVDLGDWHPVQPDMAGMPAGMRRAMPGELAQATTTAIDVKRVVAQYIIDETGRPRASSWRTITSSDGTVLTRGRSVLLDRHYVPARIGEQRVCQLVMTEFHTFNQGRERPLKF